MSCAGELHHKLREAQSSAELGELLQANEKQAYRLFRLTSDEVREYYDQALRQRRYAFLLGAACIMVGFIAVFGSIALVYKSQASLNEKIVVAALGAGSGVLSNFVAVLFLRMFTEVVSSMVEFHARMVNTYHVLFGNFIVTHISDTSLRDATIARLALTLLDEAHPKESITRARSAETTG